ncbi:MAG: ubiquinol oxidase subunit II [Pseudomonadota bacterium]
MTFVRTCLLVAAGLLLAGCEWVVMSPSGDIARQQADLIIYSTILMLIIILPVIGLTFFFAWRYRESNKRATYEPDWDHSISLEIVVWSVPLAIIICLAGLTWVATHRLNPYDPVRRISLEQPVDPDVEPLIVQVVAMDWKWVFIYPEQGIATINEAAAIVDRPIEFQLTSDTVMNSFYIPALAGQIYAMAGMQTELNAVINEAGTYKGISAHYNGYGFNEMNFDFLGLDQAGFDAWVETVKGSSEGFDQDVYVELQVPSIGNPKAYYGTVRDGIWDRIVNMCVNPLDLCRDDMMMVDALGGGGLEGLIDRELFRGICSVDDPGALLALIKPELQNRARELLDEVDHSRARSRENEKAQPL